MPTEAEWEYMARAKTQSYFSTGDSPNSLLGYANVPDETFKKNLKDRGRSVGYSVVLGKDGFAGKAPVGSFKSNDWLLSDMHGNVFEWCFDGYAANAYSSHAPVNPYNRTDNTDLRVIRGGCYM